MAAARQIGRDIPRDIAIAGFDDSPGSRTMYPPLTTVRQPIPGMARNAISVLLGHADALEELVPELIIRGSTQPGATADVHGEDM